MKSLDRADGDDLSVTKFCSETKGFTLDAGSSNLIDMESLGGQLIIISAESSCNATERSRNRRTYILLKPEGKTTRQMEDGEAELERKLSRLSSTAVPSKFVVSRFLPHVPPQSQLSHRLILLFVHVWFGFSAVDSLEAPWNPGSILLHLLRRCCSRAVACYKTF